MQKQKQIALYLQWLSYLCLTTWMTCLLLIAFEVKGVIPSALVHYSNLAHLFPKRVGSWSYSQIQGRFSGGERRWVNLSLSSYSSMDNYGYLTRLDRILTETQGTPHGRLVRIKLSSYIAKMHAKRFPQSPELREIRYLRVIIPVGTTFATPSGRWSPPPLETVPNNWVREVDHITAQQWENYNSQKGTNP